MKLTGHEDLRVQKTVTAIRETFAQMLMERDFDQLTVKELCERARINKKTFYRYYGALEDVLAEYQRETAEEYLERTRNLTLPRDIAPITEAFFRFSEEKGPLYELVTSERRFDGIRQEMIEQVTEGMLDGTPAPEPGSEEAILAACVSGATMAVYREWIASGKALPVDEVIELTTRLLSDGTRGLPTQTTPAKRTSPRMPQTRSTTR